MGAASSIVILDYDINYQKFRVFKRIEIPRSEYTYDNAVNKIIEVNNIYRPAFIYVDAGAGKIYLKFCRFELNTTESSK